MKAISDASDLPEKRKQDKCEARFQHYSRPNGDDNGRTSPVSSNRFQHDRLHLICDPLQQ